MTGALVMLGIAQLRLALVLGTDRVSESAIQSIVDICTRSPEQIRLSSLDGLNKESLTTETVTKLFQIKYTLRDDSAAAHDSCTRAERANDLLEDLVQKSSDQWDNVHDEYDRDSWDEQLITSCLERYEAREVVLGNPQTANTLRQEKLDASKKCQYTDSRLQRVLQCWR
ncbi:MAG: hypothetical protein Q9169_005966 [Polycauliona sp. 2 TL-2023]